MLKAPATVDIGQAFGYFNRSIAARFTFSDGPPEYTP
jgi:hypothetical protein